MTPILDAREVAAFETREWTEGSHPALRYEEMLGDAERMRRYRDAIAKVVRPGDVVADVGTGLGVLAVMAARAGAARVYAIEQRPAALWLAEKILRANHVLGPVRLVSGDAREVRLAERVDVAVSELIGDFGTDEGVFETLAAFLGRNLAPGGRCLPDSLDTFLVPVEYGGCFRGVFNLDNTGVDLRPALELPLRPEPVLRVLHEPPRELAAPALVERVRFGPDMGRRSTEVTLELEVARAGVLQGFVGFFDAGLTDRVRLRNHPAYPGCHWRSWNWPVTPPQCVEPGTVLRVELRMRVALGAPGWTLRWSAA